MMRRLAAALAALSLCASASFAKVLVVYDVGTVAQYTSGADPTLEPKVQARAVQNVLDRFGSDYKVLPGSIVTTEFCRTGLVYYRRVGVYGYDLSGPSEQFDAVVHLAWNGGLSSSFSGYNPDSLTLNGTSTVPQLFIMADQGSNESGVGGNWDNGVGRITWVNTVGYQQAGGGSGNHEGEGSVYSTDKQWNWFDNIYGATILRKASKPSQGMRVILGSGANRTMTHMEPNGLMEPWADSTSIQSLPDSMKVWELQAKTGSGVRITFATIGGLMPTDSLSSAGLGIADVPGGINYPVLMCALAHLDSLASGNVFGRAKVLRYATVIYGGGTTSGRRNAGGLFIGDSTAAGVTADSLRSLGIPYTVAADPESLDTGGAWQKSIFARLGSVRYAPYVRVGMDTSVVATSVVGSRARPVDPFGRFRNRVAFSTDTASTNPSTYSQLLGAKNILARNGLQLSGVVVPFADDWSPYQVRGSQNLSQMDSVCFALRKAGFIGVISNSQGRDSDPGYLTTNPVGWGSRERQHTIMTTGLSGVRFKVLMHSGEVSTGSTQFFSGTAQDSVAPLCVPACPGPNVSVSQQNRFWRGFFANQDGERDYQFDSYDGFGATDIWTPSKQRLYAQSRASILWIPAQHLGGTLLELGFATAQSGTVPTRVGWWTIKHVANVARTVNFLAGRTLIVASYPEDIEP